jgi:hypothetical protein
MIDAAEAATPSTVAVISPGYSRIAWAIARAANTSPPGELTRSDTGPDMPFSASMNWPALTPPKNSASRSEPTITS